MSEFDGLWKHENNQHALVPPKTECGCPSGGGIKKGHIRYPSSYGGTQNVCNYYYYYYYRPKRRSRQVHVAFAMFLVA